MRAEVRRCPGEDCVVTWKDGDLAGWKGCPSRGLSPPRGAPSQEARSVTGARAVVGCSKGLPQQSSPPS